MIPDDLDAARRVAARLLAGARTDTFAAIRDRHGMHAVTDAIRRADAHCAANVRSDRIDQARVCAAAGALLRDLHTRAFHTWDARYQASKGQTA